MLLQIMNLLLENLAGRARALVLDSKLSREQAVQTSLDELAERALPPDEASLETSLKSLLGGLGPLEPFMADPAVEELWFNHPNELFVHSRGITIRHEIDFDESLQETVVERLLRHVGRRIDKTTPFVDAALPDGSRMHVVIPDITKNDMSVNIRKYVATSPSLSKLGSLTSDQLHAVRAALRARKTVVVSGATAAGKTTLLSALLAELDRSERIVSVEDTFELSLGNPDWVAMQTRPVSIEGGGEVDLRRLTREALRMRPGWLVVGEVRGAEAIELLVALNSGIPALCTIHANSARHAMSKLITLPLLAGTGVPVEFVKQVLESTVGLVIHCGIDETGSRKVQELMTLNHGDSNAA